MKVSNQSTKVSYEYRGKVSVKAPKFWSVQFEVVEGCNRKCSFCAIHSIRDKNTWEVHRKMDVRLFERIVKDIGEYKNDPRVEFDNHGEPTLHPQIVEMIALAREYMPKSSLQIQSNGDYMYKQGGLKAVVKQASSMFKAGLNIFVLNAYDHKMYDTFNLRLDEVKDLLPKDVEVINFYHNNPKNVSMYHKTNKKYFLLLDDLLRMSKDKDSRTEKSLVNQAGGVLNSVVESLKMEVPPKGGYTKTCSRPHREMCVGWDGSVAMCCYDWSNSIVLGKFPEMSTEEIWNSKTAHALRYLVSSKVQYRNFSHCDVCSYKGGWRLGFLPKMKYTGGTEKALKDLKQSKSKWNKLRYPGFYHVNGVCDVGPNDCQSLSTFLKIKE